MKTFVVILTFIATLLAGSFSPLTAHAMPMSDNPNDMHMQSAATAHDCCDETTEQQRASGCEDASQYCQHCEQHCAGQLGVVTLVNEFNSPLFIPAYSLVKLSLWQRNERLIRPPKLDTV